jgi:hypothetical protein
VSTQLNKQDQRGGDLYAHHQSLSTGLFTRATRLLPDTYAHTCKNVSRVFQVFIGTSIEDCAEGGRGLSQLTR